MKFLELGLGVAQILYWEASFLEVGMRSTECVSSMYTYFLSCNAVEVKSPPAKSAPAGLK